MNKLVVLLISLSLLVIGTASAYGLYIDCPKSIQAGQPLKVSVDSDFPAGTSFDLVFYETRYTATEIARKTVTIQDKQQTQYILFDTQGLRGGNYKMEIQFKGADEPRLRSDSVTLKLIELIDRSGEITITSPLSQDVAEALRIEGSISKLGDDGIKIEVRGPSGPVFGPQWIDTSRDMKSGDGKFTMTVPAGMRGDYTVDFTDTKGFVGTITFHVTDASPTKALTTIKTPAPMVTTRPPATTIATPTTTPTQSVISPVLVLLALSMIGGIAVVEKLTGRK
jgi:hypothetical protein